MPPHRGSRFNRRRHHLIHFVRHLSVQCAGKLLGRFADQIGLADAWKELRQADDPAALRLAAGNPEDVMKARQRLGCGIGVRGFQSLTNSTLPLRPTCCMRCASPGKLHQPFLDLGVIDPDRNARGDRAGRVLGIV